MSWGDHEHDEINKKLNIEQRKKEQVPATKRKPLPKHKPFIEAEIRKLIQQVTTGDISFSRMVEIMNEQAEQFYK